MVPAGTSGNLAARTNGIFAPWGLEKRDRRTRSELSFYAAEYNFPATAGQNNPGNHLAVAGALALFAITFQYVPGRSRCTMSIFRASCPTRMRGSRRSTPLRMRAAAASGEVGVTCSKKATAASRLLSGAWAPSRARLAIGV